MYFTREQLTQLDEGHCSAHQKFADLRQRYVIHRFQNAEAHEHATHGFSRRLGTLIRCIDNVFEILPPDQENIPSREQVVDATINIQSFVFNIFGCCDNLAWIWVRERRVVQADGSPLAPKMVGLGKSYKRVRGSFSKELKTYLDGLDRWFDHMKDFRDALAHRIPLYIPPYMVAPEHEAEYQRLENAANEALFGGNIAEHDQLLATQKALMFFRPWMTHSFNENAPKVVFHAQLLADFNTVDQIGRKLLGELDH